MSNLFVPAHMMDKRGVPRYFTEGLRAIDPALIVYWNPLRARFVIDRCTAAGVHHIADHQHTPECPRTNVKIVQDEAGQYRPLARDILQWLREHDTWAQHNSSQDFIAALNKECEEYNEKLRLERKDNTRAHTMDNKRQLLRAYHLFQQHDMKVNQ
jgi:hypothetical protein